MLLRAVCRMPVILPVWFFAIAFPFFGPINSTVGALLVTFTVYIIPCTAHMRVFYTAKARQVSTSKIPTPQPKKGKRNPWKNLLIGWLLPILLLKSSRKQREFWEKEKFEKNWKFHIGCKYRMKNPFFSFLFFSTDSADVSPDNAVVSSFPAPECGSEASFLHAKLDCNLPCQHFHCHLDSGNWHRMGWLGKCYHFQGSNQNFWCVCAMLSMPTNSSTSTSTQPKHHPP